MRGWMRLAAALALVGGGVAAEGLSGSYLAARQAGLTSDYGAAAQYYARALVRDPSNPRLMEATVQAFVSLGQVDKALAVADRLIAVDEDSQLGDLVHIAGLAEKGDWQTILDRIASGDGVGPLVDGLISAWAQLGLGDMTKALEGFDAVAQQRGLAGFAAYHKALALASVGDFEGAEAIYASPDGAGLVQNRRGALARVEVLSQLDRNAEARALIDDLFGTSQGDPELDTLRTVLDSGQTLPFTHSRGARDGAAEVFFSIAGALNREASDDYTLIYSRVAEFLRPEHFEALLLSASLLERMERYELATDTYKRVPRDNPGFHAAELGRAEALRQAGKDELAIEVLEQLAATHGTLPMVQSTLGDFLRQEERFDEAIAAYDRALDLTGPENERDWFIHYARGIAYERTDRWDQAEQDFRRALELSPDQPQVLNYLGYSLVEKKIKLDEALSMIERAVEARPESGYIIDSLGWVLFRLGRFDEAVPHMERAAELLPIDPVVNDHLGDVYWAVGRALEADFQWRRALSFVDHEDASGEVDPDRIRAKLEKGLDRVLEDEGAPPLKVSQDNGG